MNRLEIKEKALKIAIGMGDMGNLEKNAKRFEKYLMDGLVIQEPQQSYVTMLMAAEISYPLKY